MTTRRGALAVLALVVAGALAWYGGIVPGGRMNPEERLAARPTFEQVTTEYTAMLDEMRRALTAVTPSLAWRTPAAARDGGSFCSPPYTKIAGAESAVFDSGDADRGIPDADWPAAVRAVDEIARRYGFRDPAAITPPAGTDGGPAKKRTNWTGPYDESLEFGSYLGTILSVYGSCYLDAAHHPGPDALPAGAYDHLADQL